MMLVAVVLLAGIRIWSDSMAGESDSSYAADTSTLAGKIDPRTHYSRRISREIGRLRCLPQHAGQPAILRGFEDGAADRRDLHDEYHAR